VMSLRRAPVFALTVVAAMALTIGPTTAILSVGSHLLWRAPEGVSEPDRLAVVWFGDWLDNGSVSPRRVSDENLRDLEDAATTIAAVGGWQESLVSLAVEGAPSVRTGAAHATVDFFEILGVRPSAGRAFVPADDYPPFGSPVVILSDVIARSRFGAAESALGQSVVVNGRRLLVVGVMSPGFHGVRPESQVDVWLPSLTYYHVRHFSVAAMKAREGRGTGGVFYTFVVRLTPEATFESLQAELDVLVPSLATRYPDDNDAFTSVRARVFPRLGLQELQRDDASGLVRRLLLVGGMLVVLGCANVANLLIFRGVRRRREYAVRLALGAGRRRLVQMLLVESCLLAVAGAALGVGLAVWFEQLIRTLLLPGVAQAGVAADARFDLWVLGATLGISLMCGVIAGVAPAWFGSSSPVARELARGGVRASTGGLRVRTAFAATQLALSLALVTNAVLLVATLRNLSAVDVGFDPHGVSVYDVPLGDHGYTSERAMVFNRQLVERLSSDATFSGVSLSLGYPPRAVFGARIVDPRGDGQTTIRVGQDFVTPGYFRAVAQPLQRGRTFTPDEAWGTTVLDGAPVVVDAALARRLFGDSDALGRTIHIPRTASDPEHDVVVVGIVKDLQAPGSLLTDPTGGPDLTMYAPFSYGGSFSATRPTVLVRSGLPPLEAGRIVQSHVAGLDGSLSLQAPRLLTDVMAQQVAQQRVFAWVVSLLGALGFVLAAVGLYGLLAQMVGERTRELGIRMALGADRRRIVRLVARQAAWVAVAGGVVGLGLAALGSRLVEAHLFGLTRLEPWVYATSAAAMVAVVFAASFWPARAATKVEPVEALRAD
jgi:putative ABC transport system permease protein